MQSKNITTEKVHDLITEGARVHLIDVRTQGEFSSGHASHATNIPLDKFTLLTIEQTLSIAKDDVVYLICQSGARSAKACELMRSSGFENVFNVVGGTLDWINKGLPTKNKTN